jgi:hypothetical protein
VRSAGLGTCTHETGVLMLVAVRALTLIIHLRVFVSVPCTNSS